MAPYDYRPAYCVLVLGTANGSCPPRVETGPVAATSIDKRTATVTLIIEPNGSETKYWVRYGSTSEYGSEAADVVGTQSEGRQTVTLTLTGLGDCLSYHYVGEAENEANGGTVTVGKDRTLEMPCAK